jgi:hypothetical protein
MDEGFEFALHVSAIEISEKLRLSGEFYDRKLHRWNVALSFFFLLARFHWKGQKRFCF